MGDAFEAVMGRLFGRPGDAAGQSLVDVEPWLATPDTDGAVPSTAPTDSLGATEASTMRVTAAFLAALAGPSHPDAEQARAILDAPPPDAPAGLGAFYRRAIGLVRGEVEAACRVDEDLAARLTDAAARLDEPGDGSNPDPWALSEILWPVFFPEGLGIRGHETMAEEALRARRMVTIEALAPVPIADPAREVLFTSNVLLTLPPSTDSLEALPYDDELRTAIAQAALEPQRHWYDHPIQLGVEPAANELLYGLRALDEAVAFEVDRTASPPAAEAGSVAPGPRPVTCLLSVSVTHDGLRAVARPSVTAELAVAGGLGNLDVHAFTEADTLRLVDEVLVPAAARSTNGRALEAATEDARALLTTVFGVDGAYGRHYSFLKAVAALWQVLIDEHVRATFKIDLDQVFPQAVLVAETGASAFEHLATPRWGARGSDAAGRPVELGLLAGALVNERDIGRGLFTPDVDYPSAPPTPDQHVFMSGLPQALSTRAEMMTRYDTPGLDGSAGCLERVHVTGGTNGILVDALRRHRPFTPSFMERAEDQAYILSTFGQPGARLAYAHEPGLVMRHDKEAFAGEAIAAAEAGRLVGDDVRILLFSAYADLVAAIQPDGSSDVAPVKALLDPFTGCFVSRLPRTVALLRFALRIAGAVARGRAALAVELATVGPARLDGALDFTAQDGGFRETIEQERRAWSLYYDTLDALEVALEAGDAEAEALRRRAIAIVAETRVGAPSA